jgi:hypothetical protein
MELRTVRDLILEQTGPRTKVRSEDCVVRIPRLQICWSCARSGVVGRGNAMALLHFPPPFSTCGESETGSDPKGEKMYASALHNE